ncbi:PREDICTED: uncharacterized protein LOC108755811 [Trachymyrmex septentrionalis]|nr:PREDICTED: uncharacterized protein LOC108755811 [Trachymyrmex septentrionalis]XP_018354597.1 PREDICTED: uncharacterized protein LOC108755811 [Trachymyrmex septentrionalis]XP_018354598.1 PREDICTED: uncharacterized protein LOC108755811 [Trachymyrmex septentrionalis]XP_018354599.1 PREDICTED: uncharacterized protein LOC108755811 [Trachymyrmex septentrionalis]XP_018354600.1 PREDICTED: uncharacterized protein LOC108755811 [Trachymyrmex septentrionalis]
MRNPALHSVGIATSPGGGEVFGSRAEEELRQWLETRLDALGIDPVAYSRFVLSLLRRPDSALSPPEEAIELGKDTGCRIRARPKAKPTHGDGEQRQTVVQYLTNAADDKYGVDALVDELCIKLKELEGGSYDEREESEKSCDEPKTNLEALTLRDKALRYYAAFPALQSVSFIKTSPQKDRNFANSNNNKNYEINLHNKNKSARNKKTKMSINIESQRSEDKESFGFAKSMEREREKELDQLRLAQLKAKFESLEALWNSVPGNAQDTASIWAAPTLSIPSGPLWPTDTTRTIFTLPTSDNGYATDTSNQESIIDESPLIPWDIDLISIEDNADECSNKDKTDYNISWLDSFSDGPWCWREFNRNLSTNLYCPNAETGDCFFPVASTKTPLGVCKESRSSLKVNSLPEPDEDLLTSARTHFRPIKDDGHWADGTTFPVNNTVERVAYRRSESGNLLYLPGGESPYMEYRENDTVALPASTNLTLKFRVRQCDKSVQTEPVRSPVKRRILSEQDHFRYSPVGAEDAVLQEQENIEKDSFALDQLGWVQSSVLLHNDRKRRHSSSYGCQPLTTLRPLTL